jgi:hypothetical protein
VSELFIVAGYFLFAWGAILGAISVALFFESLELVPYSFVVVLVAFLLVWGGLVSINHGNYLALMGVAS